MEKRDVNLAKSIGRYILSLNNRERLKKFDIYEQSHELIKFNDNIVNMAEKTIDILRNKYSPETVVYISFDMKFEEFYRKEELLTKMLNVLGDWQGGDVYTLQKDVKRSSGATWICGQTIEELRDAIDWLLKNITMFKEQESDKFYITFNIDINNGEVVETIEKSYIEINF